MFGSIRNASALLGAGAVALSLTLTATSAKAISLGTVTTPDSVVNVTPGNLNGWVQNGYLNGAPGDPTAGGGSASFVDNTAAPGTTNGAWQHTAVYPSPGNSAFYELGFGGLAGRLVSDWQGFAYSNFQALPSSNHAVVYFEIDLDGNLATTGDISYIRFQPLLFAQSQASAVPANEWNTYGVDSTATKFLDAVNTGTVSQKKFQSIAELFLPDASKVGTGTGGVTIPSTAVFNNFFIAGGFQGFANVTEQVDYIQFTFGTDGTTRYDFGAESLVTENAIPEPATAGLTLLALSALVLRRRRA